MKRIIYLALAVLALLVMIASPVVAAAPKEDPAESGVQYSGLSLLLYFSGALDQVLAPDPLGAAATLEKMPFVNVPEELAGPCSAFAGAGIALAGDLRALTNLRAALDQALSQTRPDEAEAVFDEITAELPGARDELGQLVQAVQATRSYLGLDKPGASAELGRLADEIGTKTDQLKATLELLAGPLPKANGTASDITLSVNPVSAFVGDDVRVDGILMLSGAPFGNREVQVLLNNTATAAVRTDSSGRYSASLKVPARYTPELVVQAIYAPQGADQLSYLGCSSPKVTVSVQYYRADLSLSVESPVYSGRSIRVNGSIDYGPGLARRMTGTELFLDGDSIIRFSPGSSFSLNVNPESPLSLGEHSLLLSAPGSGRFAPIQGDVSFQATRAATAIEIETPSLALAPRSFGTSGRVTSPAGPVAGARIQVEINGAGTEIVTTADGSFSGRIGTGTGLTLLGYQTLEIQVIPGEAWNQPVSISRRVFIINVVYCGALLALLVFLAFFLPRRIRGWFGSRKRDRRAWKPAPVLQTRVARPEPSQAALAGGQLDNSIIGLYRTALALVRVLTRKGIRPEQTYREYAEENKDALGRLGKYLLAFTLIVERLLYSSHRPSPQDLDESRRLSQALGRGGEDEHL